MLICDNCGFPIGEGEPYFELPDGLTVCAESDCLADWASPYRRHRPRDRDWEEESYEKHER
ncbi:MAG: hypothetical protein ACSW8E_00205 [Clostridia bacterium]